MNRVFFVGRISNDPRKFDTSNGIAQVRFNIAVADNWNYKDTYFFSCVAWNKTALYISQYIAKGDLIAIDGRLIVRNYKNKQQANVSVTEVVVETIKLLSKSHKSQSVSENITNYDVDFDPEKKPSNGDEEKEDYYQAKQIDLNDLRKNSTKKDSNDFNFDKSTTISALNFDDADEEDDNNDFDDVLEDMKDF